MGAFHALARPGSAGVALLTWSVVLLLATPGIQAHSAPKDTHTTRAVLASGWPTSGSCPPYQFSNSMGLAINGSQCRPWFNSSYVNGSTNSSLDLGLSWLSEVTAGGEVVSLANLQGAPRGALSWNTSSQGTTFRISFNPTVFNGSGVWAPNDSSYGAGPQKLREGAQFLGIASLTLSFHLKLGGANDTSVKFDVNETGWPWVNPSDSLGVELDTFAPPDSSLSFAASTSNLTESTTSGNSQEAALVLGASASVSSGGSGSLTVSTQAGIFSVGRSNDVAALLLTFSGPGGYAGLSYDPWVNFYPSPASVPVSPPLSLTTWVAIIAVVAIAVVLGAFGLYVRRKPIEEGLSPVADRGRRTRAWT